MTQAAGPAVGEAVAVGLGVADGATVAGTVGMAAKEATGDGNAVAPPSWRLAQPASNSPMAMMRHSPCTLTRIHILPRLEVVVFPPPMGSTGAGEV